MEPRVPCVAATVGQQQRKPALRCVPVPVKGFVRTKQAVLRPFGVPHTIAIVRFLNICAVRRRSRLERICLLPCRLTFR